MASLGWFGCLLLLYAGVALAYGGSWADEIRAAEELHRLGRFSEADQALRRALVEAESAAGKDDHLAYTLNGLGSLYQDHGDFIEGEKFYLRSLAAWRQCGGESHPGLARTMNNLASLYAQTRQPAKAERLLVASRDLQVRLFGPDHPETARVLGNLAATYFQQHRFQEAERLYLQAIAIWEKRPKAEDKELAFVLSNLAALYCSQGRTQEALSLLERAQAIWEQAAPEDPGHADALVNLAATYRTLGKSHAAEPLLRRAIGLLERALSPVHPRLAPALLDHAAVLRRLKRVPEAKEAEKRARSIQAASKDPARYAVDATTIVR